MHHNMPGEMSASPGRFTTAPRRPLPTFASPSPPFLAAVAFNHAALTTWRQRARTATNRSCGTRVRTNARVRASVSATPVLPATEHAFATLLGQGRGELDPCPPYHWSETKTYVREHLIHNHVRMLDPIRGELAIFPASCWSNLLVKHAWRLFRAVPLHRLESILCSIRVQCVCVACKIQRHSSAAQIGQPQPVE
jgi:hypothetical protein